MVVFFGGAIDSQELRPSCGSCSCNGWGRWMGGADGWESADVIRSPVVYLLSFHLWNPVRREKSMCVAKLRPSDHRNYQLLFIFC